MRLLFIDDSSDDVLLATDALRRDGLVFEERGAMTLEETAAALEDGPWSAVISDYNLGKHTGLDVLKLVRAQSTVLPFILLSGAIGEERAVQAMREGANDYVMKDRMWRLGATIRREIDAADACIERQRLELQLQHAEERYRTMFERAPVGIANVDRDGRFLRVNHRLRAILGYEEHELIGTKLPDLLHPEDTPLFAGFEERFADGEAVAPFERRMVRKDGCAVWITVTLSTVRDAHGEPVYLIGSVEDITEQKATRDKLLLQARLLDCVGEAVVATGIDGRITYWNLFAEELYDSPAGDTKGRLITDVMLAADAPDRNAAILDTIARGASWSGEVHNTRSDGSKFPAWLIVAPLFDHTGSLIGAVCVAHDLTELKEAENDLRAHKAQLAVAQEMARVGSWTYDYATGERQWSEALCRIYGFAPGVTPTVEETIDRVHPDDRERVRNDQRRAHGNARLVIDEFRILTPEGERVMAMQYRVMCDPHGAPVKGFGVVQDVTESRHLEEELRRRTVQQSAVGNLGQLALSGASTQFLLEQAVDWVGTILSLDSVGVLQKIGEESVLVAGTQWHPSAGKSPARALAVPIRSADGSEWGVLAGSSHHARPTSPSDSDFLRSIAIVIGQALDRAAADAELRTRALQQSVIAKLGRLVLTSLDDSVYTEVCDLLKSSIDADFTVFRELRGDVLYVRAGSHFQGDTPPPVPVRPERQGGYAVLLGQPVLVDDYRTDTRFETSGLMTPHGVLSGAIVPVASAARTYGVLSAQSRKARHFRQEDVDFLQSLANLLADAMERDAAQRAVEISENRFRLLLESTVEGIYTLDMNGRCTMVNRAAASFLGVTPEEIIGQELHSRMHARRADGTPNPIDDCPAHGVLRHGEPISIPNDVFTRKDGTLIPVAYSVAPIIDRGERVGAVVTFIDQTERRKLEARLEQANRLNSLGRLAATVAHEFNNVLMGIAPFVEVVRRAPSPQKVQASLDHITSSVRRGRRITEDILRFTQPAEPALSPLDVTQWLESIGSEAHSLLGNGYHVAIDTQRLWIDADSNQLHQIIANLLLNAKDAMPNGGTISIKVSREKPDARFNFGALEDPSRFAHFAIRDSGCGMPDETLQHVFEPLFTTKKNGTGLGLAVTHQVVQRHGGEIFVESTIGAGTTFHIFIPLSVQTPMGIAEGGGEQPNLSTAHEILLVEDDPTVAAGIHTLLEFEGFTVTVAETGRDALAQAERHRPDAVVLDVGLPDLDGKLVYAELMAMHPALPVIFSTGHADRGNLEHLLTNDNVRFLLKPYEYESLLEALTAVTARG